MYLKFICGLALHFLLVTCMGVIDCAANIGVIIALDPTLEGMLANIKDATIIKKGGRTYYQGSLDDAPVVLVQSPMGKVNNAITAQILISEFSVDAILSISPAGAVSATLQQGDLLWATKVFQHDFGTWKPYGFIWTNTPAQTDTSISTYNDFLQKLPESLSLQLRGKYGLKQGILVSGDQFIASEEKREWLRKKFSADATDMGGAAIVQTCFASNIPVSVLRLMTDHADQQARLSFHESVTTIDHTEKIVRVARELIHFFGRENSQQPGLIEKSTPRQLQ